ncbi:transposase [Streptomyces sp. NPDC050516]|uniref:IS110 family transposase n=1 Tax=Streptomyces sp. NPDC050516 TaxID=3365621 RepID=UPI0037B42F8C
MGNRPGRWRSRPGHRNPPPSRPGRELHLRPGYPPCLRGLPGEGKTDAKDAGVIADQVRIRRDLHPLHTGNETVTDLKILTGRRMELVADPPAPSTGSEPS